MLPAKIVPVLQLGSQQRTSMKPVVQFPFSSVNKTSVGFSQKDYIVVVEITIAHTVMAEQLVLCVYCRAYIGSATQLI
jgi:hypothetical protein